MKERSEEGVVKINKIVNTLKEVDFKGLNMPMVVVYERPEDFPCKYVARVFELEKPTNVMIVRDTLHECREDITAAGFLVCMERSKGDKKSIVETWM